MWAATPFAATEPGGSHIHTAFLSAGLADELLLAIGTNLVGGPNAPRFLRIYRD
ncbi:hypothetical protein [Nocardia transvalensis]|uniref:hypothetical protein n=1 Tax=Nocardia transvalensis TaxID=37333 RepID=UPI001E324427|nr:hypothetical protein [Nocardia transvalensis]